MLEQYSRNFMEKKKAGRWYKGSYMHVEPEILNIASLPLTTGSGEIFTPSTLTGTNLIHHGFEKLKCSIVWEDKNMIPVYHQCH